MNYLLMKYFVRKKQGDTNKDVVQMIQLNDQCLQEFYLDQLLNFVLLKNVQKLIDELLNEVELNKFENKDQLHSYIHH